MSAYPNITKTNMELTPMQVFWSPHASKKVVTFVATDPHITSIAHGLALNDRIVFTNVGGALPPEIVAYKPYYVNNIISADVVEISETPLGTTITPSTADTGTSYEQKEVDLGGTLSNVVVTAKYTKADIKADQFGETILDRRVKGIDLTVKTALAEIRDKDNWKVAFPNITRLQTGGDAVLWQTKIGEKDTDLTGFLRLHPMSEDNDSQSYDFLMYDAVASSESTITYGPTEQAKLEVVWTILPDDSVVPARFFIHGDVGATP